MALNQRDFSAMIGISTPQICHWENAKSAPGQWGRCVLQLLEMAMLRRGAGYIRRRISGRLPHEVVLELCRIIDNREEGE